MLLKSYQAQPGGPLSYRTLKGSAKGTQFAEESTAADTSPIAEEQARCVDKHFSIITLFGLLGLDGSRVFIESSGYRAFSAAAGFCLSAAGCKGSIWV